MSQQNRKRQHQQSRPVKEEPQEVEDTHSNGAEISASQSSFNCPNCNCNTIGTAAAGRNGSDDIKELKLKMTALDAKNQILEGKLENQELRARLHSMSEEGILANLKQENRSLWMRLNEVEEEAKNDCKKVMDVCEGMFKSLRALHNREISGLFAQLFPKNQMENAKNDIERNHQQQLPNDNMPDCVVVDMPESQQQGTSKVQHRNVENGISALIPPPPIAPNLQVPCHSAESNTHGNLCMLDGRTQHLVSRHRHRATLAAAASIPTPLKSIVVNPLSLPCHIAQHQEEEEEEEEVVVLEEVEEGEVVEVETKRLCNPLGNGWNPYTCKAIVKITLPDQLIVHNTSPHTWGNVIARKGFPLASCRPIQQNNFAGPILYYYEITAKSTLLFNEGRLYFGFSYGTIPKDSWIGRTPNTYAMRDHNHKCDYCRLSGDAHFFEWPAGAVKPMLYGCGDVFGCGLVLSADDKLAIFFTTNGILLGKQFPIVHLGSILFPSAQLNLNVTVEANFGQKPFKYNIDQCPGLVLQW